MKNLAAFILTAFVTTGCNNEATQLKQKIINSDSVAINYFKGDGTMDTVVAVKIIRDSNSIQQLTGFISAEVTSLKPDCGYDGSVHFFKNNFVIQDAFFSNSNGCMQFTFMEDGKKTATKLHEGAKNFLAVIKNK